MEKYFLYTCRKLLLCLVCLIIFVLWERVICMCCCHCLNYSFCFCCKAMRDFSSKRVCGHNRLLRLWGCRHSLWNVKWSQRTRCRLSGHLEDLTTGEQSPLEVSRLQHLTMSSMSAAWETVSTCTCTVLCYCPPIYQLRNIYIPRTSTEKKVVRNTMMLYDVCKSFNSKAIHIQTLNKRVYINLHY